MNYEIDTKDNVQHGAYTKRETYVTVFQIIVNNNSSIFRGQKNTNRYQKRRARY